MPKRKVASESSEEERPPISKRHYATPADADSAVMYECQLVRLWAEQLTTGIQRKLYREMAFKQNSHTLERRAGYTLPEMQAKLLRRLVTTWSDVVLELDELSADAEEKARLEQRTLQPELAAKPAEVQP